MVEFPTFIEIKESFCGRMYVRTDIWDRLY